MDHTRRSKPVWRSVIGPVSLGLLWPSILGAFWFYILTEFGNPLAAEAVNLPLFTQQVPVEQPVQSVPASSYSIVRDDAVPSHARLSIAGKTVVDEPLTHMGHLQVHPDGTLLALDLFPTGTETMEFGQIRIFDTGTGEQVAAMAGHAPFWNVHAQLEFATPDRTVAVFDVETGQQTELSDQPADTQDEEVLLFASTEVGSPFLPTTIRVQHHPQNYCRQGVAENEVVTLPMEEYVARVLPAEVPPTWNMEALKAMAIAARTYAWNKIYQNRSGTNAFDVSDWANNQTMCDYRHERSDLAVQATAGMIMQDIADPNRLPILSMYSTENSHPTKKHSYLTYLDSVPDPNALGFKRRGHGWGLSQLGAQRFAKQGLNFCQILGHYYSNIHITGTDAEVPLGCLIVNGARGFATGSGLHFEAVVASHVTDLAVEINDITPDSAPVLATYDPTEDALVQKQAADQFGELVITAHVAPDITHAEELTIQSSDPLAMSDSIQTQDTGPVPTATPAPPQEENSPDPLPTPEPAASALEIELEEASPTPTPETTPVATPEPTPAPTATGFAYPVTLALDSASRIWSVPGATLSGTVLEIKLLAGTQVLDTVSVTVDHEGPKYVEASLFETESRDHLLVQVTGASGDGFSMGRDWTWEQSSLNFTSEAGALAQDPFASDGLVWLGDPDQHTSGIWFGPYTSVLPGARSYRALFRVKMPDFVPASTETLEAAQPVARLDVTHDQGKKILGFRELYVTDFRSASDFTPFGVDFHLFEAVTDLEFRVHWHGTQALALDQVTVVSYPFRDWEDSNFTWPVVPDSPIGNLRFAAFDQADNMSTLFTLNLNQTVEESAAAGSQDGCQVYGDCLFPAHPSAIQ